MAFVKDANATSDKVSANVKKIKSDFHLKGEVILDTSPDLVYYGFDGDIHLSLWDQVLPEIKEFFNTVTGNELEASRFFGLLFYGFFLPHELGHALQEMRDGKLTQSYDGEYDANTIAMLWWRKHGRQKELGECYILAKKSLKKLPNPVPEGKTIEDFFTESYVMALQDPRIYPYVQFT